MAALALVLGFAALSAAAGVSHPFTASLVKPKLTVNYRGYITYNVESRLAEQFTSVQHCLPIQLIILETKIAVQDYAVVNVNSTSLEDSYTIHPYVENRQLRLSLNGTVKSDDLVNVTITVPTSWSNELANSTVTGLGYVNFGLTSAPKKFQMQLSGRGTVSMGLNPAKLVVSGKGNGSFFGGGLFNQVMLKWASGSTASLKNAANLIIYNSGTGGVYVGAVTHSTSITQGGGGVTAVASTDTASVVQSGSGAVFLGVGSAADVSYSGNANTTYIQGTGRGLSGLAADVSYDTAGTGSLLFSATANTVYPAITVNGNALTKCLNLTGWSSKVCNESAVPNIPLGPDFPQKVIECKGTWILIDSEMCYTKPEDGYVCKESVTLANLGVKFAMVIVLICVLAGMNKLNTLSDFTDDLRRAID